MCGVNVQLTGLLELTFQTCAWGREYLNEILALQYVLNFNTVQSLVLEIDGPNENRILRRA